MDLAYSPRIVELRKTAIRNGLTYVTDGVPGIARRRAGKGWVFYYPDGTRITDAQEVFRIRSLAIPPAWKEVWICPDPKGHIQATARDARGRKQYRYHTLYREARDHSKFRRMLEFSEVLPAIRARVERDLGAPELSRRQILAATVRLLDKTLIRVGNDEYAKENRSYGLTTLRKKHVSIDGSKLRFTFRGKSGVQQAFTVTDRRIARIVQRCQDLPGVELFKYMNAEGKRQSVTSDDVNEYLRNAGGNNVSAKDFRTWGGTILAAQALRTAGPAATKREAVRNINRAIDSVAERLGNTRTVCKKYYVHPSLLQAYMQGLTMAASVPAPPNGEPSVDAVPVAASSGTAAAAIAVPVISAPVPETARRKRTRAALRRDEVAVLQFLEELDEMLPEELAPPAGS
ncbi:MAG: DNA topoisomerase IB [Burkholderiales bacterium]